MQQRGIWLNNKLKQKVLKMVNEESEPKLSFLAVLRY